MDIPLNQRIQKSLLCLVFFVLFFTSFQWNVFHIAQPNILKTFQRDSEGVVLGRIMQTRHHGLDHGGLLGKVDLDINQWDAAIENQYTLYFNETTGTTYTHYISHPGGQAFIFTGIDWALSFLEPVTRFEVMHGFHSATAGIIFALFVVWVFSEFGLMTAGVLGIGIFLSGDLALFAKNLYWPLYALFGPFVGMLFFIPFVQRKTLSTWTTALWLLCGFFLGIFLKLFLSGYEYIFAFLCMTALPIVYYAVRDQWKNALLGIYTGMYGVASIAGISLNILLLSWQVHIAEGISMAASASAIFERFTYHSGISTVETIRKLDLIHIYIGYAPFHMLPIFQWFAVSHICILFICLAVILVRTANNSHSQRVSALLITSLLSVCSPLSYLLLFNVHAFTHQFLDYIVWYMPFLLFFYILFGYCLQLLLTRFHFFSFYRFDD